MDESYVDRLRRRFEIQRQLNELRAVYHATRQAMTDDERRDISDEMARLRQHLADVEGHERG